VAVSVFNSGGDPKLDIPTSSTIWEEKLSALPKLTRDMPSEERRKIFAAQRENRKAKAESHSLYCSSLYKLSLAQHFRNDVLWYPLNMDFRGRVYPCPPHLNHMGNDLTRGLLKFAKGKPLGDGGLDWLKIHVVNMTGLKKRDKVENRLIYANEIIDEIVDSGVDPLGGRRWWMESEEPWQTLAACKEIAAAIESEDAKEFISHLPVHQDGSCNGLQHYAALGRDQLGAESVNLCPSEFPNDVYSDVLERVEEQRRSDAENGVAEAQVLEGLLSRKVIKQTIMTTVYGVTIYGARIQVENRLKEIPQMPRDKMFNCSFYLAKTTFACLAERFTTTKEIQDWLVDCAVLITKMCKNTVSWETPLGLPVSQPYFKMKTMKAKFKNNDRLALADRKYSAGELLENEQNLLTCPNSKKNQNAFPPNFIHSLDSTHMMLTTLHAHRQGICFNAVHDCYWTHASDIDQLNDICRQQFLKLHSLPILEDLSQHLLKVNSWEQTEPVSGQRLATQQRMSRLLKAVMENVPHRGEYNIEDVLDSVYFFS
jgi:DNA-directed RNA polymerase